METIHIDFSLLKQDVQNLHDRTGSAEKQISNVKDSLAPLSVSMCEISSELAALQAKVDDLKNRSRHINLQFVGF